MCGIVGQINLHSPIDLTLFKKMRDTLKHRGPDGEGISTHNNAKTALGHRRLSIIDLSESGKQPMCNEDESIWLTYNGEIYNYAELRKQLITHGHTFKSTSDSEVIVHGYEEWGKDVVSKLKGMFAFGIWDENKQELFLARDRFGIKPLYYYLDNEKFIFGSEIKAIIENPKVPRDLNVGAIADFLTYRFVPGPKSIWNNMFKLLPAHYMTVKINQKISFNTTQYWDVHIQENALSEKAIMEQTRELLTNAVKQHLVSDVPVGVFLSGGYDSTLLVYLMHVLNYKTNSYAIGFDDFPQSEHEDAAIVADHFHTSHHENILSPDSLNVLETLSYYFDEPFSASSMIGGYFVSKEARKSSKTVLAGDGGDEVFSGYQWHNAYYDHVQHPGFSKRIKNLFNKPDQTKELIDVYAYFNSSYSHPHKEYKRLFNRELHSQLEQDAFWFFRKYAITEYTPVKSVQNIDIHTFLPEACLTRADRCGMANSLEVRVPFLDHELMEYIMQLQTSKYFRRHDKKVLLKKMLEGNVPNRIINKPKKGFSTPMKFFLDPEEAKKQLLHESLLVKDQYFNRSYLASLFESKKINYPNLLNFLVLELWYRKWAKTT